VPPAKHGWTTARVFLILAGALTLFILISVAKGWYTEWLWFDSLGYGSVYTTILKTKVLVFFSAAFIFGILFLGNLVLATRLAPKTEPSFWPWAIVRRLQPILRWNIILGTALLSLIFGLVAQGNWEVVLRFFNGQPFGITDPVFHREISFYVFSLPFLHLLQGWLLGALIVTLLGSAGIYLLSYTVQRLKFDYARPVLAHVGGLVIAILGLFAWGYWLGIWELVFSTRGVIFGASYADMHAKLPAQWILLVVVLIFMGVILLSVWRRNSRWPLYGIGGWIVVAIIVGGIFPGLVQRFQVEPNELAREMPYIEYNIEFTREAFALNRIEEQPFPAEEAPTPQDIAQNEVTINNIRLWDPRPLKDTYNQIQSFRLYYDFHDVDIDRYIIDGEYRQVMLSARELSAEKLAGQAQTWVNRKLQFTHGYGLALSPVNEVTAEGLPVLRVKDIPPVGVFNIERPEIYFGEKTNDYIIVGTKTEEFNYPMGDENVFTRYQGKDGVRGGLNYIRNSVKAVIDAYDGSVTFYVTDPEDALIRTYQAIFPHLFVPAEQAPESLRVHFRYPEDFFNIQASVYQTYHMEDARVFYNKEDLWAVPKELYFGTEQLMEPYYIIMRLSDKEKEEFLLMLPFTPVKKNNTIGWLAARSDGENYGKLLAYHFSKERLVYGPSQIENRVSQDTVITEQLALWGRGGSRVIRGNLLLIPLGKSNLYVEPVFLQAEAGGLPQLKRVIVAAGDKIAMEPTLGESIAAIFGTEVPPVPPTPPGPEAPVPTEIANLIEEAQQHYNQAQQYLKAGDWTGYGEELEALKAVLERLAELTAAERS